MTLQYAQSLSVENSMGTGRLLPAPANTTRSLCGTSISKTCIATTVPSPTKASGVTPSMSAPYVLKEEISDVD